VPLQHRAILRLHWSLAPPSPAGFFFGAERSRLSSVDAERRRADRSIRSAISSTRTSRHHDICGLWGGRGRSKTRKISGVGSYRPCSSMMTARWVLGCCLLTCSLSLAPPSLAGLSFGGKLPGEVQQAAVDRAAAGERITWVEAEKMIAELVAAVPGIKRRGLTVLVTKARNTAPERQEGTQAPPSPVGLLLPTSLFQRGPRGRCDSCHSTPMRSAISFDAQAHPMRTLSWPAGLFLFSGKSRPRPRV
jgi:hypothetical protein